MGKVIDLRVCCSSVDVSPVEGDYRSVSVDLYEIDPQSFVDSLRGNLTPSDVVQIIGTDGIIDVLDYLGEDFISQYIGQRK